MLFLQRYIIPLKMKCCFLLFSLRILFFSCTNHSKNTFSSKYHIIGSTTLSNNKMAYLKSQKNHTTKLLDSSIIKNGKFEFKGKIKNPEVYGIFIDTIKGSIPIFMENTTITILVHGNDLKSSKITGSKTHTDYLLFLIESKKITSKINLLFPEFQKARVENDISKLKIIHKKMQSITNENTQFALNYSKKHPESYVSAFALYSILSTPDIKKDRILDIYNHFSVYVKKGNYSKQIFNYLAS